MPSCTTRSSNRLNRQKIFLPPRPRTGAGGIFIPPASAPGDFFHKIGIPWQVIRPLIYMFVRACVHYALFEDEEYLKPQLALIEEMLPLIAGKYAAK